HRLRSHLETAADDHVVGAAVDVEKTVGVEMGEVTGRHPLSVATGLRRVDLQSAGTTGSKDVAVVVDDLETDAGKGASDAAALVLPLRVEVLDGPSGDRSGELGGAVD